MPLNGREFAVLSLLVLIVPAQYFLTNYNYNPLVTSRSQILYDIVNKIQSLTSKTLPLEQLTKLCNYVKSLVLKDEYDELGESPAIEVIEYRSQQQQGFFASSKEPRYVRPHGLQFRIGQVVRHKEAGYRGVIIGWDTEARAPEYWLEEMYHSNRRWKTQPNYLVMVDTRDRVIPQFTYVPQEGLETLSSTRIMHPKLEDYFEHYDGAQYLPRPWLQSLYPRD